MSRQSRVALLALASATLFAPRLFATDGIWTNLSGGLWSTPSNWNQNTIADGDGAVANIAKFNITTNPTIHLDSPRTLGTLFFGDLTPSNGWTLDNNGNPANILTLNGGNPTISADPGLTTLNLTLAGNRGLQKSGAGDLLINSPVTCTGTTTISDGKLLIGADNTLLPSQSLVIAAAGTLELNGHSQQVSALANNGSIINSSGNPVTLTVNTAASSSSSGPLSGALTLVKSGAGTLTLSNANSYFGDTVINAGTLALTPSATLPFSNLSIAANATLSLSSNATTLSINTPALSGAGAITSAPGSNYSTLTINNSAFDDSAVAISGNINLNKDGNGTLRLSAPSTYLGATTIFNGTLQLGVDNALPQVSSLTLIGPNASLDLNGHNVALGFVTGISGNITNASPVRATCTLASDMNQLNFPITGNLNLSSASTSTFWDISTPQTYSGNTTFTSGTLMIDVDNALPASTNLTFGSDIGSILLLNGHFLEVASLSGSGQITTSDAPSVFQVTNFIPDSFNGFVFGNVTLVKSGPANFTLANGALLLNPGGLDINQGTVLLSADSQIDVGCPIHLDSLGTLDLHGRTLNNAMPSGSGVITSSVPNAFLLVTSNSTIPSDVSITGNISLFVSGNKTLTLSAPQTYTGDTHIDTITLRLTSAGNALTTIDGSGNLVLATAASLTANTINLTNLTVNGTLSLRPGNAPTTLSHLTLGGFPGAWTGAIDTANNRLIINSGAPQPQFLASITDAVAFGRSHSTGIFSTALPAHTALAVLDNSLLHRNLTGNATFDASAIILSPELLGDANADGKIDLTDLSTVLNHFGQSTPRWTDGNFDYAATINLTDLSYVLNNFGLTNPAASQLPFTSYPTLPAPEPATLSLLVAPLLLRRRRR
ncbi:MAG: autotransporter-associated beta strand repeat-containing protein [Phycisphaerae bacterium]